MKMLDIIDFIKTVKETVDNHSLGAPGAYQRWRFQDKGKTRDLGVNAYGCADAANILYTIGGFPGSNAEREGFIATLQGFQNPSLGMFKDETHHDIHTTAHCVGALDLFDAKPKYPLASFSKLKSKRNLEAFLENLDWRHNPWIESHKGAGLFSALSLCDQVSPEWCDWYFQWLWEEADPETGFWRKGHTKETGAGTTAPLFHHLAGSFHYLFVHEYAHRPLRYPHKMIDSCLTLFKERHRGIPLPLSDGGKSQRSPTVYILGREISFSEIDWVYCLNRSHRQTDHRFQESIDALREFAKDYIQYLLKVDPKHNDRFNDLHWLFGMVCALAELQQALPGFLKTEKPLRLVLDRRPFI